MLMLDTFFDCNISFGPEASSLRPCLNLEELDIEAERAGLAGGLVRHAYGEPILGNRRLSKALMAYNGARAYYGVYSMLPSCTREIPSPQRLPAALLSEGFRAIQFSPDKHRYLAHKTAIGNYLCMAQEKNIPVIFDTGCGISLEQTACLLTDFPSLTVILCYANCWPSDRLLRPFLENFPKLTLDLTFLLTDQGIEEIVELYSARRLVFGSGFPASYIGSHMMVVAHSDISDEDKKLISGGNLHNMIAEARYD
jgi:hypothetical protein